MSLVRRALPILFLSLLVLPQTPVLAQEARWKELSDQVEQLTKQGKYDEALPLAREALKVAENTFGSENLNRANALDHLGTVYWGIGKYADAEQLYKRAIAIREQILGPENPDVAGSLSNLAVIYSFEGRYGEAEPVYKRALAIREKELGPEHPDVAGSLNNLANFYQEQGRYAEAEPLHKRALAIREKELGPEHPDVARSLNNLANVYGGQGRYAEAEPLFMRALAIWEKVLGPEHPTVSNILTNLANVCRYQGRYAEAEPLYKRALAIREKALGADHPYLAQSLNNLADLYQEQGRYAEAEPLHKRALAIREKALGPDHPEVARSSNDLGTFYGSQGRYAEAEPLLKSSLAIREKGLGPEHPDVAASLSNVANVYDGQGRYPEAEPLYKRALAIREKALGPEHPDVAGTLYNLANIYTSQELYAEAEPLYKRALAILEKTPQHPVVTWSLSGLALLYRNEGNYAEADRLYRRAFENLSRQLEYSFTYMSERDRLSFLNMTSGAFPTYFSFCAVAKGIDPGLAGRMYDGLLLEKGIVANSVAALRAQIATSTDKESLAQFDQLSAKRRQLAALLTIGLVNRDEWRKTVEQLQKDSNDLEQELVRRSGALAGQKKLAEAKWQDVQKALGKQDAAVEFVRFAYHDGKRLTDNAKYAALVVTPDATMPQLVLLGDADKLEDIPLKEYRYGAGLRKTAPSSSQPSFYDSFWKPLETTLGGAKRVYVSPDGVLNQVSLGVVRDDRDRLLMQKYDLRIVSSTKDLLREKRVSQAQTATLVGNPKFDLSAAEEQAALENSHPKRVAGLEVAQNLSAQTLGRGVSRDENCPNRPPDGFLCPLPGTETEVASIQALLQKSGWQVSPPYTGERALKEVVRSVQHPRVLHIATHGFFEPDQDVPKGDRPTAREDPMLRSGLLLAGADRTLKGEPTPPDLDNGVLTAFEASSLDLQGTELVVLSACETGLGEVQNGEGVFGLRRALQEAGAQSVLMSMWSVPDRETQELMTLFYERWLGGKEKAVALREAQMEMRKRVKKRYHQDLPFYWGGFVLVGR
jgi:tetratricopeptide (TPR) repeat protein